MAVVAERPALTASVDIRHSPASHHRRVATLTTIAGVALALLAGRDGTLGWQIGRLAAITGLTIALVAVEIRLGDRGCGRIAVGVGVAALSIGLGFTPYAIKEGLSLEAVAGMVAAVVGLLLAMSGTVLATRGRPVIWRLGAGVGTIVVAALVAFVVAPAVAATNVPRPDLGATPASRGRAYETVTLSTADGVRLAGWYVPSTNRAAVVLLHGAGSTRSDVLDEAVVLASHGVGVLMIDARGHGDSGGRAMDFGWHGDADIAAATGYLAVRPDVDRERIGVVGMSMGGEQAIGASASNPLIRAVVAEGATARTADDEAWLSDQFGFPGFVQEQLERVQDWITDGLTSASVPTSLRRAVETSGDTRYLLITAGDVADEAHAAAYISAAAPERVRTWTVPDAGHTAGLHTQPRAWEERVIGFLTEALAAQSEKPR